MHTAGSLPAAASSAAISAAAAAAVSSPSIAPAAILVLALCQGHCQGGPCATPNHRTLRLRSRSACKFSMQDTHAELQGHMAYKHRAWPVERSEGCNPACSMCGI